MATATYYLPVFNKDKNVTEWDIDSVLGQYGFGCLTRIEDNLGVLRTYSADLNRGGTDIEARVFTEPVILRVYHPIDIFKRQDQLCAMLIFHNVSEESYYGIESAVNTVLNKSK